MRTTLGALIDWREVVPRREWARVESLIRRYERLAEKIDRRYEAGEVEGIENLEAEAEGIHEKLIGLYHTYAEETEWPAGEGIGLEEYLAVTYTQRDRFASPEDWIENMRDAIRTELLWLGRDVHPTDEQVLEVAKDAYERRSALIERYRKGRKTPKASLGDADGKEWRRCGNTSFYEILSPAHPDAGVFVDPVNRVMVTWHGYPGVGGKAVYVTRTGSSQRIHPETIEGVIRKLPEKGQNAFAEYLINSELLRERGAPPEQIVSFFTRGLQEEERSAVLRATLILFSELGEAAEREARVFLRDELEEALAGFGIIEC